MSVMNHNNWNVYFYGLNHGFWFNYSEFRLKLKECIDQVEDLMFKEEYGVSKCEYVQTKLAELEEYQVN